VARAAKLSEPNIGPHDAHRALLVLKAKAARKTSTAKDDASSGGSENQTFAKQRRISWARLLARVFKIDVEVCPNCSGRMRIIAAIKVKLRRNDLVLLMPFG